MKQLTYAQRQQLEVKIEEEKERQRARRMNPHTPVTSSKTDHLHKYGMLALILCLLVFAVMHPLKYRDFAYDEYGNLMVALMLLFNHIAYNFTKTGWKNRVMKTVARIWVALGFVYIFWGIWVGALFA
ncbi:hypothetical protein C6500_07425 [Candidatus Poribacteria bacterium]|nr:MAG: hypothetical protein C6500_07425 [Candidatus Poribacteria bacterium]